MKIVFGKGTIPDAGGAIWCICDHVDASLGNAPQGPWHECPIYSSGRLVLPHGGPHDLVSTTASRLCQATTNMTNPLKASDAASHGESACPCMLPCVLMDMCSCNGNWCLRRPGATVKQRGIFHNWTQLQFHQATQGCTEGSTCDVWCFLQVPFTFYARRLQLKGHVCVCRLRSNRDLTSNPDLRCVPTR